MRYREQLVRKKGTNQLPIESVEQTIKRIEEEMDLYLDYEELCDFFTVKGRPLELSDRLKRTHAPESP